MSEDCSLLLYGSVAACSDERNGSSYLGTPWELWNGQVVKGRSLKEVLGWLHALGLMLLLDWESCVVVT